MTTDIACRHCAKSESVRKHGFGRAGLPRYYCLNCKRSFQSQYIYKGHEPDIKSKINELRGKGVTAKETSRRLKIGINTVTRYSPKKVSTEKPSK